MEKQKGAVEVVGEKNKNKKFGNIKEKMRAFYNSPYFFVPATVILIVAVFVVVSNFYKKPEISKTFEMKALISDDAGVKPETGFVFSSEKNYSIDEIKKLLKFSPAVDFSVEKLSGSNLFSSDSEKTKQEYKIQPTEELEEGNLYQAVIDNSDFAEREFSWAFQVKAPFQVSKTFPRNKGTSVPLNSGIEINFNRQSPIDPQDYFSISPKVEGSFEARGDMLIFKSTGLKAETVYTVTIKKGIKEKNTQESIEKDFVFNFETGRDELNSSSQYSDYFSFNQDWTEFLPGKKPLIQFYSGEKTDLGKLDLSLYKLDSPEEFANSYASSRRWDLTWGTYQNIYNYVPPEEKKILSFKPEIKTPEDGVGKLLEIPQELEAGYYVLHTKYKNQNQEIWFQVSPLANYFSVVGKKGIFWLYDFTKNQPISNSKVSFLDGKEAIELGKTKEAGLLEFETPKKLLDESNDFQGLNFFKVEAPGFLPKVVQIFGQADEGNKFWSYISLDKPVYKMSDSVNFWGVVKGRQENMKEKTVTVNIREQRFYYANRDGSNDGLYASQKIKVSPFDTIQGKIDFKGFSPGTYVAEIVYGKNVLSTSTFEVMDYTKPAYQIIVAPEKDQVYAGEEIKCKVRAEFFDGTPVSNLELSYTNSDKDQESKELKLDANGEAEISYTPEFGSSQYYPYYLRMNFRPKLAEEGEIFGEAMVQVFGADVYLQSFSKKGEGGKNVITAKLNSIVLHDKKVGSDEEGYAYANDFIGDPIKNFPLKVTLIKMTYPKEEVGEYYDEINKVTRKRYVYKNVEEEIDSFGGSTNEKGEWVFQKEFPKNEDASYKIIFSVNGNNGRKTESTAYVYNRYYNDSPFGRYSASLKASKDPENEFIPGETIGLKVAVEGGDLPEKMPVLFYRYRNEIDKVSVGNELVMEEKFDESFVPATAYRGVVLGPQGFLETNSAIIFLDEKEKELKINIETDKKAYRPKDKIKVNFGVSDKNGEGVASQINASVVDEAIFKVANSWQEKILTSLYSFAGGNPITGASNYSSNFGAEMGGCFLAGTKISLSNGETKAIEEVRVGDVVETFSDLEDKKMVPAIVQGLSRHWVNEYLVINEKMRVTPEHRLLVNGDWMEAGQVSVGDKLILNNGQKETVEKIQKVETRDVPVYNIVVGKYHTYFADGYFVHNEEKGGGARSNFLDVASFQSVNTKSNGKAEMEFMAPDNVTAWRLTARAFAPEKIMAGEITKLIKTTLPFFVEATLSNVYIEGDEPVIKLRTFGDEYKQGEKTTFSLKSKSLDLDKTEESTGNTTYVSLGKMKEGEHSLTITAKRGEKTDSIIRKIRVVKSYTRQNVAKTYNLDGDLEKISGNSNGMTTLVFSDRGKGKYFPAIQEIGWDAGMRLDQLTARYLGQKTLKENFGYEDEISVPEIGNYYTKNGSLALFPNYGSEDLELSAKIADAGEEFVDKGKMIGYFQKILTNQASDLHQAIKSLYGLASLKQPVLDKINVAEKNSGKMDLEDKTYLALSMVKIGDKERARSFYLQEIRPELSFKADEGWAEIGTDKTKNVKFTATVAYLLAQLDMQPDLDNFWNYLEKNQPTKDLDSLERMMLINVSVKKIKSVDGEVSIESPLRKEKIILKNGVSESLTVSADELKNIKISGVKGKVSLTSYFEAAANQEKIKKDERVGVERSFENISDGSKNFKEGDLVRVILNPKIKETAPDGNYQIMDFLPSGLRPAIQTFDNNLGLPKRNDGHCRAVWYPSRVESNTVYFDVDKNFQRSDNCQNRSLVYFARVVSTGSYKVDGAIIQSINSPLVINYSQKDEIAIKPNPRSETNFLIVPCSILDI